MSAVAIFPRPQSVRGSGPVSVGVNRPAELPAGVGAGLVRRWVADLAEPIQTAAWRPDHQAVLVLTATGRLVQLRPWLKVWSKSRI